MSLIYTKLAMDRKPQATKQQPTSQAGTDLSIGSPLVSSRTRTALVETAAHRCLYCTRSLPTSKQRRATKQQATSHAGMHIRVSRPHVHASTEDQAKESQGKQKEKKKKIQKRTVQ
jgi:hypothetical protein